MSAEKFIRGKQDDAHHEGRRSTVRRLAETDDQLRELWPELWDAAVDGDLVDDRRFTRPDVPVSPPDPHD